MRAVALTTTTNPFDPFDDFNNWYREDELQGTKCCEYIANLANWKENMSNEEKMMETERVIDEIIAADPFDRYKKVVREVS